MRNKVWTKGLVFGIIGIMICVSFGPLVEYVRADGSGYVVATGNLGTYSIEYSARKIARASNGHLYVVYKANDGIYNQIYLAKSTDDGITWTNEGKVHSESINQEEQLILIDSLDRIIVIWRNSDNYLYSKIRTDATWGSRELISNSVWKGFFDAVLDVNNNVHVLYSSDFTGCYYRKGINNIYQSPEPVSTVSWQKAVSITVESNGDVHAFYGDDSSAYYVLKHKERTAGVWGSPNTVSQINNEYALGASAVTDDNDNIHVVWNYKTGSNFYICYRRYTSSWESTIEYIEGPTIYYQRSPSLSIDASNNLHTVWLGKHSGSPTYEQVRHCTRTSTWGTIEEVTNGNVDQGNPFSIWGLYPEINGAKINRPQTGYAFVWNDGSTIRFYKSSDLTWTGSGSPPQSTQPLFKAPWIGIQKISQGNNGIYSHHGYSWGDNTYAIDVVLPIGSDIIAPADGTINWYDDDAGGLGGKELAIDHVGSTGIIYTTVYLHLSEIIVKNGYVAQGQLVAKSGNTGDWNPPLKPHLHFHIFLPRGYTPEWNYDSHTQPIERLILKQIGIDNDFKEYNGKNGDLDDNKIAGNFFESNNIPPSGLNYIEATKHCPVELSIQDSQLRVTGLLDGVEMNEIPNSVVINNTIQIYQPTDSYTYKIKGINDGTYNLTITNHTIHRDIFFNSTNIPIINEGIHVYSINWSALTQGQAGITLKIDNDGDGVFERIITSDSELTQDEFVLLIDTTIDFDPNTLNRKSNGNWVTSYIELPPSYNVSNITISSILLNEVVHAQSQPTNIGDYDNDGIPDLMVKFSRSAVAQILQPGDNVEIRVSGTLVDGTEFEGLDYITVK